MGTKETNHCPISVRYRSYYRCRIKGYTKEETFQHPDLNWEELGLQSPAIWKPHRYRYGLRGLQNFIRSSKVGFLGPCTVKGTALKKSGNSHIHSSNNPNFRFGDLSHLRVTESQNIGKSKELYERYKMILLTFILSIVYITSAFSCLKGTVIRNGGLSCYDKQLIVEQHNRLRQLVALGKVNGQPPAANMLEMSWDEELAEQAQRLANTCIFQHDSSRSRRLSRFPVGQNLALSWSSPTPTTSGSSPDFSPQINNWFNEVYLFGYSGQFNYNSGHYSQMIWGDTYLVGCGYTYFVDGSKYTKLYVCNYGPAGNILGAAPYRSGTPSCSLYGTTPSVKYYGLCEVRTQLSKPCHGYYGQLRKDDKDDEFRKNPNDDGSRKYGKTDVAKKADSRH